MSAKYPYLDIAISVMSDGAQPVNYSFNSAPTIALPSLSDLARHFVNLSDGYVMWQISGRRAFTYFKLNDEGTMTVMAITVRLDPDVLIAGRPIVNLLGTIRRTLSDGSRLTHESLMHALSDSGFPEEPLRSEADVEFPAAAAGLCWRTYISPTELANIFAYPRQKDYAQYQGVIVVPATVSMQPESSIPLLTGPVNKALMVVCPKDVTASANRVELSDHLTVTYSMGGFDSQSVEFEVGTTNRYVRINGPALVVNSALHAGIIFSRTVPYTVMSATGSPIDTFTILINGRTATRGENSFEVSSTDFHDGKVTIAVSSTNFGSYTREFTPEELGEACPLEIVLEPEAKEICLRIDFGSGRIIESSMTIEKSTPEYNSLRAGTFHGFRAHRMMGSTPETYNIDVRQLSQPVAGPKPQQPSLRFEDKTAEPVATVTLNDTAALNPPTTVNDRAASTGRRNHNGPVAPAIGKAPSAIWEEKQHKRVAPKFENIADGQQPTPHNDVTADLPEKDVRPANQEENKESKSKMDIRLIMIGLGVIAAGLVLWYLLVWFSGSQQPETPLAEQPQGESIEEVTYSEAAGQTTANATPEATTAQPAQTAVPAASNDDEKADIEYLNTNNVWKLSDLKSEKYRALITAMQKGDIEAVASNPYFATSGTAKNAKAEKVIGYLWFAKGSLQEKRNIDKLRTLTESGKADLGKLIDDLSRYQPKDGNEAPRPGTH
ncbi:MAG: hypothetical protein K2L85_06215 [Paramuribaculum sp.]|nr:hypothetical protein [Paramuribaculum sp.]